MHVTKVKIFLVKPLDVCAKCGTMYMTIMTSITNRNDTDAEEMKETQERSWMRMNRIILASHGGLSAGMKDTVQMILGELPNLYALATLRDETEPITVAARRLLDGFAAEDAVYIVTDVMGGSVNNEMLTLLPEYPAVHLICGMNASLVLTLASNDEALTQDELAECIADAKAQIIDCNLLLKNAAQDEEDDL